MAQIAILEVDDTQWDVDAHNNDDSFHVHQQQHQSNINPIQQNDDNTNTNNNNNNNYIHHPENNNNINIYNHNHNHQNKDSNIESNTKIEISYHNEQNGIFGCNHYARNCWLRAECCNQWYVCRFCHDEHNEDLAQSKTNNGYDNSTKPHQINRYSTKYVRCMRCGTEQRASKYCINCTIQYSPNSSVSNNSNNSDESKEASAHSAVHAINNNNNNNNNNRYCLASYYCDICKFYDNKHGKEIFHCLECGLCRLGKKSDYIHCQRCGCCLNYKYYAKHPCIENSLKSDCPICFTYLFKSREPVTFFMPCGHPIHYECLMQYAKVGLWKCPICRTAWYDEESEKRKKIVNAIKERNHNIDNDGNPCL